MRHTCACAQRIREARYRARLDEFEQSVNALFRARSEGPFLEQRMMSEHQGRKAGDMRCRRGGTVRGSVTTAGNCRNDGHSRRGKRDLRACSTEAGREDIVAADQLGDHTQDVGTVRGKFLELSDRSHGHDSRQRGRE